MDYLAVLNFVENSTRELSAPKHANAYKAQHLDELVIARAAAGVATGNVEPVSERTVLYIIKALNDWRNALEYSTTNP